MNAAKKIIAEFKSYSLRIEGKDFILSDGSITIKGQDVSQLMAILQGIENPSIQPTLKVVAKEEKPAAQTVLDCFEKEKALTKSSVAKLTGYTEERSQALLGYLKRSGKVGSRKAGVFYKRG